MQAQAILSSSAPAELTLADPRSDDRRRRVRLSPDRVTIERRYRGVAMRLSVPAEAYEGVAVGLKTTEAGRVYYELRLAHRDADLSVALAEALDDRQIWADWRAWADFFDLPALVERSEGLAVYDDASQNGPATARRRRKRRAAFMGRRQAGTAPATLYRETEIVARS